MMEILKDFPDNVLAIKASGRVTKQDYEELLIPTAKAALEKHQKLRVYYELAPEFSGFDMGAMWEDFTFGVEQWSHWDRIAIITSVDWIKYTVNAFGFIMPCPVKVFLPDEASKAWAWIVSPV